MAQLASITIAGKSGSTYAFDVYPYDSDWNEVAAVYVVSKLTTQPDGKGYLTHIYVGQTDNLKERHTTHHKADCFERRGANCLCVHIEKTESRRRAIEADLLAARTWPCNG